MILTVAHATHRWWQGAFRNMANLMRLLRTQSVTINLLILNRKQLEIQFTHDTPWENQCHVIYDHGAWL